MNETLAYIAELEAMLAARQGDSSADARARSRIAQALIAARETLASQKA